jgi:hypothetical protein
MSEVHKTSTSMLIWRIVGAAIVQFGALWVFVRSEDFLARHAWLYLICLLALGILASVTTWLVFKAITRCALWIYRAATGRDQPLYFDIQEPDPR